MPEKKFHTIIAFKQLQPDTIVAIILLKKFGEAKFPGISEAKVKYVSEPVKQSGDELEKEGIICLDMGQGRFDHHRQTRSAERFSVSDLVARALKIADDPALEKILTYARRDDLEGKGIISTDPIDRAFGMSGLIQNLNRAYPGQPDKVLKTVAPLFLAHLKEEERRFKLYPEEYRKCWDDKKVDAFIVKQRGKQVRCILIESDVLGMAGFLRVHPKILADVVGQKLSSGHINIITKQWRRIDLRDVVAIIRVEEMRKKKIPFDKVNWKFLLAKGRMKEVEEWYYDTAANSLQNGGMMAEKVPPTNLDLKDIKKALKIGLDYTVLDPRCPKDHCRLKKCPYYFYNLLRCRKIRMGEVEKKEKEKEEKEEKVKEKAKKTETKSEKKTKKKTKPKTKVKKK